MEKYNLTHVGNDPRTELHDKISLTGAEISINNFDKGQEVPFVHHHKKNEEIYGILSGEGKVKLDEEEVELKEGDWIRISPEVKRQFSAKEDSKFSFICIQVKKDSLEEYTSEDGVIDEQ